MSLNEKKHRPSAWAIALLIFALLFLTGALALLFSTPVSP